MNSFATKCVAALAAVSLSLGCSQSFTGSELTADKPELDFGLVMAGGKAQAQLTLQNRSSATVNVTSALVEGSSSMSVVSPRFPFSVRAGEDVVLEVSYAPVSEGMERGQLTVAGLAVPLSGQATAQELRVAETIVDRAGEKHTVFGAYRRGSRVLGGEVIRHGTREVQLRAGLRFDDTPAVIDSAAAETTARASLLDPHARVVSATPELVYEAKDGVHRLVYRVDIFLSHADTGHTRWRMRVDAQTGVLLRRNDLTPRTDSVGYSYFRGLLPLKTYFYPQGGTNPLGSGFTLEDHLRPRPGEVLETRSRYNAGGVSTEFGVPFFDADGTFGNGQKFTLAMMPALSPLSDTGQTSGVDAHNAAAWAWDVYTDIFAQQGPFGDGTGLKLIVNDPEASSYDEFTRTVVLTVGTDVRAPHTELAVVGHEMGHAFFRTLIDDDYVGEPGGIDEANSDILGKLTEIYAAVGKGQPLPQTWPDWKVRSAGQAFRHMDDPSLDGYSYNQWWPGMDQLDAHFASGPINRMFFFLAQGVAPTGQPGQRSAFLERGLTGIGIPAAADVYFRAVLTELTPRTNPMFADLRAAMVRSAPDNRVKQAVEDAFAAINVGAMADREGPSIVLPTKFASGFPLSAAVNDPSGVKSVSYALLTSLERSAIRTPLGTALAAPWSIIVQLTSKAGGILEVCASDVLDNSRCVTGQVTRANGPVINAFTTLNPHIPYASRDVTIDVAAPGGLKLMDISFQDSGKRFPWLLWTRTFSSLTTLTWYSATRSITLPQPVTEGVHELTLEVTDRNDFTTTRTINLIWDLTPPEICDISSAIRSFVTPTGTVSGRAGDALTGMARVDFYLDSTLLNSFFPTTPAGTSALTPSAAYSTTVGPHTFTMVCTDKAGRARSVSKAVTMNTAPTVTVTLLSQAGSGSSSTATSSLSFFDPDGIAEAAGALNCTQTGHHPLNLGLVGTPVSFSRNVTTSGLIAGESCEIVGSGLDVNRLSAAARRTFVVTGTPPLPPPVVSGTPVACNSTVQQGSTNANYLVTLDYAVGATLFQWNTYFVPDNLILSCADGGTINGSSSFQTGCYGTQGNANSSGWRYITLSYQCSTRRLKVQVVADCQGYGQTDWAFNLSCR